MSGRSVKGWLHELVGQDNWGNLPVVDEGDEHDNRIRHIDCRVPLFVFPQKYVSLHF